MSKKSKCCNGRILCTSFLSLTLLICWIVRISVAAASDNATAVLKEDVVRSSSSSDDHATTATSSPPPSPSSPLPYSWTEHSEQPEHKSFATKSSTQSARKLRPETSDLLGLNKRNSIMARPPRTNWTLSEKFDSILQRGEQQHEQPFHPRIQCVGSDFAERLRQKEQGSRDEFSKTSNHNFQSSPFPTSPFKSQEGTTSWTLVGTAATVLIATTVFFPTMVWTEAIKCLNAVLSIHWMRQWLNPSDLLVLAAHVLLLQPETRAALQKYAWPTIVSTVQAVVVAEAWSYFWKLFWKSLPTTIKVTGREGADPAITENVNSSPVWPPWIPTWVRSSWRETNAILDRLVHRGTRRIIQKLVQKNIQDVFVSLASQGVSVIEQQQWFSQKSSTTTTTTGKV